MTAVYVVSRMVEEQRSREPAPPPKPPVEPPPHQHGKVTQGIVLEGMDMEVPVRFAKCCGPMPGDDIVGFITRGRGVSVHKVECPNALNGERDRMVSVSWADMEVGTFCGSIKVVAYDRIGLLADVTSYISGLNVPIRFSTTSVGRNKIATIRLVLEVMSKEQMDSVIRQLRRYKDVIDVFRVTN
jgi:GTP pyrophosphokinase